MLKNEKTALFLPDLLYLKYFVSVIWLLDDHAWERIQRKAAFVCFFKQIVTVQSQAKFQKTGIKCVAFWRLALNSYKILLLKENDKSKVANGSQKN